MQRWLRNSRILFCLSICLFVLFHSRWNMSLRSWSRSIDDAFDFFILKYWSILYFCHWIDQIQPVSLSRPVPRVSKQKPNELRLYIVVCLWWLFSAVHICRQTFDDDFRCFSVLFSLSLALWFVASDTSWSLLLVYRCFLSFSFSFSFIAVFFSCFTDDWFSLFSHTDLILLFLMIVQENKIYIRISNPSEKEKQ